MKYAILLSVLGIAQIAWGCLLGAVGAPLVWSGLAWTAVGAAYAGIGPRVFGKRPDGSMSPIHVAALFPFLLFTWTVWRLGRRRGRACGQEIVPGLWLGRRPLRGELSADVVAVVDLTSEFPKSPDVGDRAYLCRPLLDATAPDAAALASLGDWIGAQSGPVFVHCAAGHGRSATLVAAVLVARGIAVDEASAMKIVQAKRPHARLNSAQTKSLREFAQASSRRR